MKNLKYTLLALIPLLIIACESESIKAPIEAATQTLSDEDFVEGLVFRKDCEDDNKTHSLSGRLTFKSKSNSNHEHMIDYNLYIFTNFSAVLEYKYSTVDVSSAPYRYPVPGTSVQGKQEFEWEFDEATSNVVLTSRENPSTSIVLIKATNIKVTATQSELAATFQQVSSEVFPSRLTYKLATQFQPISATPDYDPADCAR